MVVAVAEVPNEVAAWAMPLGFDEPEPLLRSAPSALVTACPPRFVTKDDTLNIESARSSWLTWVSAAYLNAPRVTCPRTGSLSPMVPASATMAPEGLVVTFGTRRSSPPAVRMTVAPARMTTDSSSNFSKMRSYIVESTRWPPAVPVPLVMSRASDGKLSKERISPLHNWRNRVASSVLGSTAASGAGVVRVL